MTSTAPVHLEPFVRIAQRLRDDVCVFWRPSAWVGETLQSLPKLLHQCSPNDETTHSLFSVMHVYPIKIKHCHPDQRWTNYINVAVWRPSFYSTDFDAAPQAKMIRNEASSDPFSVALVVHLGSSGEEGGWGCVTSHWWCQWLHGKRKVKTIKGLSPKLAGLHQPEREGACV